MYISLSLSIYIYITGVLGSQVLKETAIILPWVVMFLGHFDPGPRSPGCSMPESRSRIDI